jgi:hypothetical protein
MPRLLLAALCGLAVSFASAADPVPVKLVHVATGKVLAVEDHSEEAAARAVLAKDGTDVALQWTVEKDGDHLKITNKKSGKVLDVNEDSKDEDAAIIQYDAKDEGADNQRWKWEGKGDERRLVSKSSGLVVVPDADGKLVQKKADEKAKDQLWKVVEVKK